MTTPAIDLNRIERHLLQLVATKAVTFHTGTGLWLLNGEPASNTDMAELDGLFTNGLIRRASWPALDSGVMLTALGEELAA